VSCTPDPYPLGGTISGLKGSGLVLANGAQTVAIAADGNWQFGTPIGNRSVYGVTVLNQPTGQTCTVSGGTNGNGTGTIKADKTNVNINLIVNVSCV